MNFSSRPRLADRRLHRRPDEPSAREEEGALLAVREQRQRPEAPAHGPWRRAWLFALNFLKHPLSVGSFLQSSPALVRRLLDGVDWSRCRTVVELGPGVGPISGELLARLRADARLLLVERNADFVAELQAGFRDPRVRVIHGSAADLSRILAEERVAQVDVVVSGIPFSTLPAQTRGRVLDAVRDALHPDGQLLVYQHSGRVLPLLQERFSSVSREIEWRNPVPMRVFRCCEPRERTLASPD